MYPKTLWDFCVLWRADAAERRPPGPLGWLWTPIAPGTIMMAVLVAFNLKWTVDLARSKIRGRNKPPAEKYKAL